MFVCPVPKISQVMMKWHRRAAQLGRFTLRHSGRRATTQISRFTLCDTEWSPRYTTRQIYFVAQRQPSYTTQQIYFLWHNGCRATTQLRDLLCVTPNGCQATQLGRFTLWHNGRRATTQLNGRQATQLDRFTLCGTTAAELHNSVDLLCVAQRLLSYTTWQVYFVAQQPPS